MSLTLTRRHNADRFGYLIPHRYGNLPMVGAVATYRPGEGRFGGAVAVEEGTENLLSQNLSDWRTAGGISSKYDDYGFELVAGGSHPRIMSNIIDCQVGDIFTLSGYIDEVPTDGRGVIVQIQESHQGSGNRDSVPLRIYEPGYFSITGEVVTEGVTTRAVWLRIPDGAEDGQRARFRNVQLEKKPFATSFVDGTRPDGILAYPVALPDDYTIACYRKSHTDEDYRHVVKLSDGTVYVDGVEDSEYDVGWIAGRNLIRNGNFSKGLANWVNQGYSLSVVDGVLIAKKVSGTGTRFYYNIIQLPVDETYTISFEAKADKDNSEIFLGQGSGTSSIGTISLTPDWKRYSITFQSINSFTISFHLREPDVDYYFTNIKLEKGNKATDWTPAPEDLGYSDDRLMFSNQTGLIDELLILPYAATEEEIKGWYEAQGPLPPHSQALLQWDWQAATRRRNVDRFGYLIPTKYGNVPMVGAVATYRPGEGRFERGAVAVEEGTTNLFTNPRLLNNGQGWEPRYSTTWVDSSGEYPYIHCEHQWDGVYQTLSLSATTYTLTYLVKHKAGFNTIGSHFDGTPTLKIRVDGGEWIDGNVITVPSDDNWHLIEIQATYKTAGSYAVYLQPGRGDVGVREFWFKYAQLEQKPFATSFVDGTRPDGILAYPIALPENHTIVCYRKSHTDEDYKHVVKRSDGKVFVNGVEDSEYDVGWIAGRNLVKRGMALYGWQGEKTVNTTSGAFIYTTNPIRNAIYQIEVRTDDENLLGAEFGWQWSSKVQGNTVILSNEWQRVVSPYFDSSGAIGLRCIGGTGVLELRNIKAELGFKATDWTPAPEDLGYDGDMLMLSNQTGLVDELLVLPYAASEEEIVSWYEAQGPLPPHPQALLQWDWQAVRPAQIVKL